MYPYHNRIKQLIKRGCLVRWYYVDRYSKTIGKAIVMEFLEYGRLIKKPVREARFPEYEALLPREKWVR